MAASELVEVVDAHLELADVPSGIPQAFGATGTSYKQKKSCCCNVCSCSLLTIVMVCWVFVTLFIGICQSCGNEGEQAKLSGMAAPA